MTHLTDMHNGATVARLEAHRDFSFAAAWHPNGHLLATGEGGGRAEAEGEEAGKQRQE